MNSALAGKSVAVAEGRQLEELVRMLEIEGAAVVRCPLLRIMDAPDQAAVEAWLRELCQHRFDRVVLMTGEAVYRLIALADQRGLREPALAALAWTTTVVRGPKPVTALASFGIKPSVVANPPTTAGIIACLCTQALRNQTIGVTLFGAPNPTLVQALEEVGAVVKTVMPYVLAPSSDDACVLALIDRLARREIDVIIFTSSAQVERLFDVARSSQFEPSARYGLSNTLVAAVGPIVADTLRQKGCRVDVCPEQGFVMKNLVQQIKRVIGAAANST